MRVLGVAIVALAVALGAAVTSSAGASGSSTYCAKVVRLGRGTVDARVNGVTVWHRGVVVHACSDRFRREYALLIASRRVNVSLVRASRQRCVAVVVTGARKLPEILFRDLAGKAAGTAIQVVGFGGASSTVGSLAVAPNCAAAWGQTVADASGATSSSIVALGFGAATSLIPVASQVAIVASADDTKNVAILAAGTAVTVSWKQGGVRQVAALP